MHLLRKFINEAISGAIRSRLSGFLDESEQLSWEIAYGDKDAVAQLKHLLVEIKSVMNFLKRNGERLEEIAFEKVINEVSKMIEFTSFWKRPTFLKKSQHVQKMRDQASKIEKQVDSARRLMDTSRFKMMSRADRSLQ